MLSTGISKKPWIWSECRSIVRSRSTPALDNIFATTFAVIATRADLGLLSCLEYPR